MKAPPPVKKRTVEGAGEPPHRIISAPQDDTQAAKRPKMRDHVKAPMAQTSSKSLKLQQAKYDALSQARQECCTGNFRIFDSSFGNFLVPVIPTREELLK